MRRGFTEVEKRFKDPKKIEEEANKDPKHDINIINEEIKKKENLK